MQINLFFFFHVQLTHTLVYQFVNCRELYTREGQLKMHWELEKQASTGVQSGGTIQKTERQGEHRQRDRQVRYRVVSEGSWACSDTLTAPQGHTPLHTPRNTHSNTPWYDYFTCPLPASHNSRQECVWASVRARIYQLCVHGECVCVLYGCMSSGVCILTRKSAVTLLIVCARNAPMTVCKMRASVLMCVCFVCVCVCVCVRVCVPGC